MQEHMIARQTVITSELATAASMLIRIAHPHNQSLHRALAKAEPLLLVQAWRVDDGVLRITSHSKPGQTHKCDGVYCECEATRGVCWHIGAWHILSTLAAAGVCAVASLPLPAVLDEADLPASSFLDGPFDAFSSDDLTGHDEFGDVIPAAPPAFEEVDELPAPVRRAQPAPFRIQPSREHVPVAGSEFERAQRLADELAA